MKNQLIHSRCYRYTCGSRPATQTGGPRLKLERTVDRLRSLFGGGIRAQERAAGSVIGSAEHVRCVIIESVDGCSKEKRCFRKGKVYLESV
jgi:hypothetical protein